MFSIMAVPDDTRTNSILFFMLYTIMAMPVSFVSVLPVVFERRGTFGYREQTILNICKLPFLFKCFWSPIMDSVYVKSVGRHKTWLIPSQFFAGLLLLFISMKLEDYLNFYGPYKANVYLITIIFTGFNIFISTMEMSLSGWCLTVFTGENVKYRALCKTLGCYIGVILGSVAPVLLDSHEFCNNWLRTEPQEDGLLEIPSFLLICSIAFIITAIWLLFKKEYSMSESGSGGEEPKIKPTDSYRLLWAVINIKQMKTLIVVLLTSNLDVAVEKVMLLQLIDAGLKKYKFILMTTLALPVTIVVPFILCRWGTGSRGFIWYLNYLPIRYLVVLFEAFVVYAYSDVLKTKTWPTWIYVLLSITILVDELSTNITFVITETIIMNICDPRYSCMYLSLLHTVSNISMEWPVTLAMAMVHPLTWKKCQVDCIPSDKNPCPCEIIVEGQYTEVFITTILMICWMLYFRKTMYRLADVPVSAWCLVSKST